MGDKKALLMKRFFVCEAAVDAASSSMHLQHVAQDKRGSRSH